MSDEEGGMLRYENKEKHREGDRRRWWRLIVALDHITHTLFIASQPLHHSPGTFRSVDIIANVIST